MRPHQHGHAPAARSDRLSNSDNAARPAGTFAGEIRRALEESLAADPSLMLAGQLIKHGFAGLTTGLYEKYPERFITYPVCEELMNSSAMGLALAGKRVAMFHVRMDFLLCGMNALFNHIPVWAKKGHRLPITFICQVGKGMGQGAQHSKDLSTWFQNFEGWTVRVPQTPADAYQILRVALRVCTPTLYVIHRELFNATEPKAIESPIYVRLCGASRRHEAEFYRSCRIPTASTALLTT